ncbi:MAG: dienelactone hydrolase family protein [Alphaproteobacteria bacterium]
MPQSLLQGPEVAPPSGVVKHLVIFLHGVGADGGDLIGLSRILAPALPDTQFLSPNAPERFDMAPFGHQWFSLMERSLARMTEGVKTAAPILDAYIDAQRDRFRLKDSDIALVGFSQGTMTALYTALRRGKPLAGVVGFSGALIGAETLAAEARSKFPVCLIHGEADEVVPFGALAHAETALRGHGVEVTAHPRPGIGHGIDEDGLTVAQAFLQRVFGLNG